MVEIKINKKNQVARRRYTLWRADPHCYYCNKELKWKETSLEHLYSKVQSGLFKGRRQKKVDDVDIYTVLSCNDCNQEQARKEAKELPRWRIWVRSKSFPLISREDLTSKEKLIIMWFSILFIRHIKRRPLPRWKCWIRSNTFPKVTRKDLTFMEKIIILWYKNKLEGI